MKLSYPPPHFHPRVAWDCLKFSVCLLPLNLNCDLFFAENRFTTTEHYSTPQHSTPIKHVRKMFKPLFHSITDSMYKISLSPSRLLVWFVESWCLSCAQLVSGCSEPSCAWCLSKLGQLISHSSFNAFSLSQGCCRLSAFLRWRVGGTERTRWRQKCAKKNDGRKWKRATKKQFRKYLAGKGQWRKGSTCVPQAYNFFAAIAVVLSLVTFLTNNKILKLILLVWSLLITHLWCLLQRSHLEMSTMQKQRVELELLIAELRDRDRELNEMVASHQKQLMSWEMDRQIVLNLSSKCAKLQGAL